jgi:hypothetical protein
MTEAGMKFEDGLKLRQDFLAKLDGPHPLDVETLKNMKKAGKFVIQEKLLSKPPNYKLHIDSFIKNTWAEVS